MILLITKIKKKLQKIISTAVLLWITYNRQRDNSEKDYTSMPYAKISVFSVETAGTFDLDSELEMYFSGVGKVKFEFTGTSDILEISRLIAGYCLK